MIRSPRSIKSLASNRKNWSRDRIEKKRSYLDMRRTAGYLYNILIKIKMEHGIFLF